MFTKSAVNIPNAMYYYQICVILILKTVLSENFMRAVYV